MLAIIGLGLSDDDISLRGLELLREADQGYAEFYTNSIDHDLAGLEERTGTPIEELDREGVEQEDRLLDAAAERDVAFLVSGDPLAATTHQDILFRARERGIETAVAHAPSVFTAVAETGLSLYKFGRTTTLTEQNGTVPGSVFDALEQNREQGLHTLLLLDIGMTVETALDLLGDRVDGELIACARLGTPERRIVAAAPDELRDLSFGLPAALVVPGGLSANEAERLERVKK